MPNSPLFSALVYDWPPFFNKKYKTYAIFLDWFMKGSTVLTSGICTYFSLGDFFESAYSFGIQ